MSKSKAKPKTKVKIVQKEDDQIDVEIIASAILGISEGVKKIRQGRLNDKAIIYLVHRACGVSQEKVKAVIDSLESLSEEYLK